MEVWFTLAVIGFFIIWFLIGHQPDDDSQYSQSKQPPSKKVKDNDKQKSQDTTKLRSQEIAKEEWHKVQKEPPTIDPNLWHKWQVEASTKSATSTPSPCLHCNRVKNGECLGANEICDFYC